MAIEDSMEQQAAIRHDDALLVKVSAKLSEFFGRPVELCHYSTKGRYITYVDRHEPTPLRSGSFFDRLVAMYRVSVRSWTQYRDDDLHVLSRVFEVWVECRCARDVSSNIPFLLIQEEADPEQFTFKFF